MSQPRGHRPRNFRQTPRIRQGWKQPQPAHAKDGNLKDRLLSWLPKGSRAFVFELVLVTLLVLGVLHFAHTGDLSVISGLLPFAAAYVGLAEVKSFRDKVKGQPPR